MQVGVTLGTPAHQQRSWYGYHLQQWSQVHRHTRSRHSLCLAALCRSRGQSPCCCCRQHAHLHTACCATAAAACAAPVFMTMSSFSAKSHAISSDVHQWPAISAGAWHNCMQLECALHNAGQQPAANHRLVPPVVMTITSTTTVAMLHTTYR
jgi:hypothetical protein